MSDVTVFSRISPAPVERLQQRFGTIVVPSGTQHCAAWLAEPGHVITPVPSVTAN